MEPYLFFYSMRLPLSRGCEHSPLPLSLSRYGLRLQRGRLSCRAFRPRLRLKFPFSFFSKLDTAVSRAVSPVSLLFSSDAPSRIQRVRVPSRVSLVSPLSSRPPIVQRLFPFSCWLSPPDNQERRLRRLWLLGLITFYFFPAVFFLYEVLTSHRITRGSVHCLFSSMLRLWIV